MIKVKEIYKNDKKETRNKIIAQIILQLIMRKNT